MTVKTYEVTLYVELDDTHGDPGDQIASTMEGGDWLLFNDPNMKVVDVDSSPTEVTSTDEEGWTPV
jgi:hypothetical protein